MSYVARRVLPAFLPLALVCGGCSNDAPVAQGDDAVARADRDGSSYPGTRGDAMLEFVQVVEDISDSLAVIDSVERAEKSLPTISGQVGQLEKLHGIVGASSAKAWSAMPSGIGGRREEAILRFNAQAVRVLMDRERAAVLRETVGRVQPLLVTPQG